MADTFTIREYPDPILSQTAVEVQEFDEELTAIIERMMVTMYANNGIGLAANQVGILKRIVVMDTGLPSAFVDEEKINARVRGRNAWVFVNPRIASSSAQSHTGQEGCLSFPDLSQKVTRSNGVEVHYHDQHGNVCFEVFTGIEAICIQHEIDHLNGITLADKMSPFALRRFKKKLRKP